MSFGISTEIWIIVGLGVMVVAVPDERDGPAVPQSRPARGADRLRTSAARASSRDTARSCSRWWRTAASCRWS